MPIQKVFPDNEIWDNFLLFYTIIHSVKLLHKNYELKKHTISTNQYEYT